MDERLEVEIRDLLKELGLSSFEQKAYLCLLKVGGGSTAQEISNNAHIPLTRVYGVMKQLVKMRLIAIDKMSNPTRFNIEHPESALRFILRKHLVKLNDHAKKLEENLEKILRNLELPSNIDRGWNIYEEENEVKSLIPSLLANTKKEALIISDINNQTFTKEFLNEFMKALDRGVTIKILVPTSYDSLVNNLPSALTEPLAPSQQTRVAMNYWEKRLFIRKNAVAGLTQFAIFDGTQVTYSVTSPRSAKYFATLLIETEDTVNEFYEDFQNAWEKAKELPPTSTLIPK